MRVTCRILKQVAEELPSHNLPAISLRLHDQLSDPQRISRNISQRLSPVSADTPQTLLKLSEEHRALLHRSSTLREERNKLVKAIGKTKPSEETRERGREIKSLLADIETRLKVVQDEMTDIGSKLPNDTSEDSPVGGYDDCLIVKKWFPPSYRFLGNDSLPGTLHLKRVGDENVSPIADDDQDHLSLTNWFSFAYGSLIASPSIHFTLSTAALLSHALQAYALSTCLSHGYHPLITPSLVKTEVLERCGFAPRGNHSQIFHVSASTIEHDKDSHSALSLAATAEIPLVAYQTSTIHNKESLPIRMVSSGRAFRAEAGGRGRESRGLYRVKEFEKVEMVVVSTVEESKNELEKLVELQQEILQGLKLPYRILDMATEELGNSAFKKYDVEVWMPGRGTWGEVCSASNCTDFQARRLSIKYHPSHNSKPIFAHTLNATALAVPRIILALVENGLRKEDDRLVVELPEVLKRFWLGKENGIGDDVRWV